MTEFIIILCAFAPYLLIIGLIVGIIGIIGFMVTTDDRLNKLENMAHKHGPGHIVDKEDT